MPGITRRAHNVLTLQVARMNSTLFAVEWKPLLLAATEAATHPIAASSRLLTNRLGSQEE
jgi:hypothetical protein